MQYRQIVFILFILLLLYYAGMIVMDLLQAKAAKTAELDNLSEEGIDISDEAKNFKPVQVSRDDPKKKEAVPPVHDTVPDEVPENGDGETVETGPADHEDNLKTDGTGSQEEAEDEREEVNETEAESGERTPTSEIAEPESTGQPEEDLTEQPARSLGYREAIMTGGIKVEKIIEIVNQITDDSNSEVGAIIYSCQELRQNPK